jgi:polysaccharide pyruvyl transferase WcaK-like protein/Flp pilus assembly protein TadD
MSKNSLELRKTLADAVELAIARQRAGDLPGAEALYLKVLEADISNPVALHNLGLIRLHGGNIGVAIELLAAASQQRPAEHVFQFNLAVAYQQAERLQDAARAYQCAVSLNPSYRAAWENLGVVQQDLGEYVAAEAAYRKALALDACSAIAHRNLVVLLRADGRVDEALRQCGVALDCEPLNAKVAGQVGAMLLARGDYEAGWPFHEWRYWDTEALKNAPPCRIPLPKWDGCSLVGKNILACGEEGIGDEIMYASCVQDLAAQAQSVLLVCADRLVPLFARSFPQIEVRAALNATFVLEQGDEFDFHIALPSLPRYMRNEASSFSGRPYLKAEVEAVGRWRDRLAALDDKPKIGVSWKGGKGDTKVRAARSLELRQLQPLFECSDFTFIDVQYGDHGAELADYAQIGGRPPKQFSDVDPLRDMDDFAALLSALDLVISVDNSTVHLAGALGVPTWVLLPSAADWRWGGSGENSVWYGSVRLWRRDGHETDAWQALLERMAQQLRAGVSLPAQAMLAGDRVPAKGLSTAKRAVPARRAILLNDTSYWYHWGCTCTSLALHQGLQAAGYVVESVPITVVQGLPGLPCSVDDFDSEQVFNDFCAKNPMLLEQLGRGDIIVANGEGTLHGAGPAAVALLYLIHVAKRWLGKNTQVINHSCYPSDQDTPNSAIVEELYRKVYTGLDRVVVRESGSSAALAKLGVTAEEGFDCLPLFADTHRPERRMSDKRVVIAGTVALSQEFLTLTVKLAERLLALGYQIDVLAGANAYIASDDVAFVQVLHPHLRGRYRLVAATSEHEWLETIQNADLLISGRFHHTIAAAWLGTPFLVSASNTAKIDGLLERLGISRAAAWICPSQPQEALARLDAMLGNPAPGLLTPATRERLLQMARRNFPG